MGLDVYLTRYERSLEEQERIEAEAETRGEEIDEAVLFEFGYSSYNDLPEAKKTDYFSVCRQRKVAAGFSEFGGLSDAESHSETIEHASPRHPDHYFKIGYFRSSYNDGGINNVLRRAGLGGLYEIFEPADRDRFVPDWRACLDRARGTLTEWQAHRARSGGVDIMRAESNPFTDPRELACSEHAALERYITQRDGYVKRKGFSGHYSNRDGEFMMDEPLRVRAIIAGTHDGFAGVRPCQYVVYEQQGDSDWYGQALEIVIETIEWVLAKPDHEKYALRWSS